MNKQLYKNLLANELKKIKKENRYRIFNSDTLFYIIEYSHLPFSLIINSILIYFILIYK